MKEATVKELQHLGGFVLAGGCSKRMKQVAQMIRAARDYRWVGIYKVTKKEFVIMAASDDEPPAYPRFPITQGLCGAALEAREPVVVGDVRKDSRYLPTFHTTRSEIIIPMMAVDPELVQKERYSGAEMATAIPAPNTWSAYPFPSSILLYKEGQGYPVFDPHVARTFFDKVNDKIAGLIEDTIKKWDLAKL